MSAVHILLGVCGLVLLAGCQSGPTSDTSSAAAGEGCEVSLGSHLCASGPAEPDVGVDPSVQAEGGAGRGGGH